MSFGGFGKGVGEILWRAANVLQSKLTRAQYLDEVTWTTKLAGGAAPSYPRTGGPTGGDGPTGARGESEGAEYD